jgi:sec-independent protein translocase protein TatB
MFDIGFSELLMVAIVALVVIGPERLPGVARNIGRFAGRLQRYVHDIKRDFNREVELEEIRRLQHEMETTVQSMQESMRAVETSLHQEVRAQQTEVMDALPKAEQQVAPKSKKMLATAKDSEGPPAPKEDQLTLF